MPDLSAYQGRDDLVTAIAATYPEASKNKVANWASQLWAFSDRISVDDIVALPLKGQSAIAFGRVTDAYAYRPDNPHDAKHTRAVEWITQDFPRDSLDQDILYSLGAFMTVCEIKRNDAERRIRAVLDGSSTATPALPPPVVGDEASDDTAVPDIEEYSRTQIHNHIRHKFTGHDMAHLVDAVLRHKAT